MVNTLPKYTYFHDANGRIRRFVAKKKVTDPIIGEDVSFDLSKFNGFMGTQKKEPTRVYVGTYPYEVRTKKGLEHVLEKYRTQENMDASFGQAELRKFLIQSGLANPTQKDIDRLDKMRRENRSEWMSFYNKNIYPQVKADRLKRQMDRAVATQESSEQAIKRIAREKLQQDRIKKKLGINKEQDEFFNKLDELKRMTQEEKNKAKTPEPTKPRHPNDRHHRSGRYD